MKRRWNRVFGGLIAVSLIGLVLYGLIPEPMAVDLAKVTEGSLEITVDDDGETRIRERYVVSAPVSGKMLRIQLDVGDPVERDETELAQIKPVDPALLDVRTRAEAQARARAAQASMQQADAAVARANEALSLAEQEYERAKALRVKDAISKSEYDAAESRYRMALAEVRSAEFAVRVATYEMDQADAVLRYTLPSNEDRFDETTFRIIAPITGRVLNVFNEDATVVAAGMELMELGDPTDIEVKVDVLSIDAVRVRPGNRVYIEHWGGDQPLMGTVRLVEPAAFLKVSALGVEEKRVNVIVDFDSPLEERETLGDGFRIEARIVVDRTEETALKIPSGALFREGDQWFVFKVIDSTAIKSPVAVGKTNGLQTEITDGLVSQDVVIDHPPDGVVDGTEVVALDSLR